MLDPGLLVNRSAVLALGALSLAWATPWRASAQTAGTDPSDKAAPEAPAKVAAPADKPAAPAWETAPPEHRGGFAVGLMIGGGVGAANGYPNDATKIGREAYYTESGLGFGTGSALWLGGALADWLNFGVGGGFSTILNGETRSQTALLLFHTDVFPLYPLGGPLRDLGATFQFGLGFPKTIDVETEETLIDGSSSYMQVGAVWEGIQAWKFRFGPTIAGHYMWSETLRRPMLLIGFRGTLYTSP